jgi:hypothetical protein
MDDTKCEIPPVTVEITASIKNWKVVDLGRGEAWIVGNIYGDAAGRFQDGDLFHTSRFKLNCHPEDFKQGEMVRTQNRVYLLDNPYTDTVVEVTGVSGSLGDA